MSVTVIKGRSGSGKSRRLTAHIRSLVADPFAKVIVIVPGSLTFETEKNIIQNCNVNGILGLQVFSMQRLAYAILDDSETFLTNAQKAMVCKKALANLDAPFHGVAASPDFLSCLAALITRLKSYNQTPQSLRAAKTSDSALKAKLNDTADAESDPEVQGRELGMWTTAQLPVAFAEAIAQLQPGRVSKAIEDPDGGRKPRGG